MRYHGTVIRPPSEARSFSLQITYGCSHNRCTFCGTYLGKPFQARPTNEILEDIALARQVMPEARRVFLADGNALVLSTRRLVQILETLNSSFSHFERTGIYANARDILNKSDADLSLLHQKGLGIVYLGLESGSDEVLHRIDKNSAAAEMIQAVHKAQKAGLMVSIIGILGIGGPELSTHHAEATGRVVSEMNPDYFSMLTLMLVPGTKLHQQWQSGGFHLMKPAAMLAELRQVIDCLDNLTHCIFRTNHASNYLPLAGTLPLHKARLLATLDSALAQGKPALRPDAWRAL